MLRGEPSNLFSQAFPPPNSVTGWRTLFIMDFILKTALLIYEKNTCIYQTHLKNRNYPMFLGSDDLGRFVWEFFFWKINLKTFSKEREVWGPLVRLLQQLIQKWNLQDLDIRRVEREKSELSQGFNAMSLHSSKYLWHTPCDFLIGQF